MKKVVLVLSVVFVFMFMLSGPAYAMSFQQFIEYYPKEYIYRLDLPTGEVNYFSSPKELEFRLEDTFGGSVLESGKSLVVHKTEWTPELWYRVYRLKNNGDVMSWTGNPLEIIPDSSVLVGYEGDIDIWRWNGNGFFLPTACTFLKDLGGPIQTILPAGFGIVSLMLSVRLLTVYFRRYLPRSL